MSHILNKSYLPIHLPCNIRRPSRARLHFYVTKRAFHGATSVLVRLLALIRPRRPPSTFAMIASAAASSPALLPQLLHFTPSIFELVEKPTETAAFARAAMFANARPDVSGKFKDSSLIGRLIFLLLSIISLMQIVN